MIKLKELERLLNLEDTDVKNLSTDQLRLLIGVLRFSTRIVQRELNVRDEINPTPAKSK